MCSGFNHGVMMKKIMTIVLSLLLVACTKGNEGYMQMKMDEALKQMKQTSDYVLVDVRTKKEYESGHIPGAINIVNEEIDESVQKILEDKDRNIYVYCRSGNRSKQASQKLVDMGYTNIIEIGGINTYSGNLE